MTPAPLLSGAPTAARRWIAPPPLHAPISCPKRLSTQHRHRKSTLPCALDEDHEANLTFRYQHATHVLGVPAGAKFDQILVAKNKLLAAAGQDAAAKQCIEGAYDVILNAILRKRLRGEMDVSLNVRFADAGPRRLGPSQRTSNAARPPRSSQQQQQQQQEQQQRDGASSSRSSTLTLLQPREELAKLHVAAYGFMGAWALVQAALESPEAQQADLCCVQLSLAVAYSAYTLMDTRRLGAGRSLAVSLAMLLVGYMLGIAVEDVVQLDVNPVGTIQSPQLVRSEFGILALLLGSLFLM